jgi:hypothetical protein
VTNTDTTEPQGENVTAEQIQTYLDLGWRLDVLCTAEPHRKHRMWHGSWVIRVISPDGQPIKHYAPVGTDAAGDATIKTANGLLGHLAAFSPRVCPIPWQVGESEPVEASRIGRRRAPRKKINPSNE